MYSLYITYSGKNTVLEWSPYKDSVKYNIYRGLTKDSFSKIGEASITQYQDTGNDIIKKFDRTVFWYKVTSVDKDGKEIEFLSPQTLNQEIKFPYAGVFRTINKRKHLMMKMTGEDVTFFIKKTASERCPKCFNPITRDTDQQTDFCDVCYNTTFKGGFERIAGKMRIRNAPWHEKQTVFGVVLEENTGLMGWTTDYPILYDGDFFRVSNGQIYVIDKPVRRKQKDFTTVQICGLKVLPTTDPYYRIV